MSRNRFIIFFVIMSAFSWAQTVNFHFKHLSAVDGLSNSSVIAMEQDKLGQMWIGTRNGLNKYNGTRFDVFKNEPSDSTTLSNSDILSIKEDSDGYIWVGTYNGLNRYDPVKNLFKRYYQTKSPNSLCNNVVICIKEMDNGEIWLGTANGISIYDKEKDAFKNIPYLEGNISSLPYKNVQRIFVDSKKDIWIGTSGGLAKLTGRNGDRFEFKQFKWKKDSQELFIQDIIEPLPNTLGLATKYHGYILFDTDQKKFEIPKYPGIPNSTDVRVLQRSNDGSIWLGTTNGIKIIGPEGKVWDVKNNRNQTAGLSQNFIKSIFKDINGSIWAGTYSGGVNIWDKSNENFVNFTNSDINNNVVTAIVSDENSNLYFGTEGGDVTILNPKKNKIDNLNVTNTNEFRPNNIQTMLLSGKSMLWVGVLNYGVYVYDIHTKKILNNIITDELLEYVQNTGVYSIKEGKDGIYWLGTFGKGLVRYDLKNRSFRVFGKTLGEEPNLSTNIIKTILIDKSGSIWAGGLGGLNFIRFNDEGSFNVSYYFVGEFSGDDIKTIFEDSNHQIWVGTKTIGLQKFNGSTFERVALDQQNPISTIYTIIEDAQGYLWLSCDRGIVKYDSREKTAVIYDQRDILSTNDFSPNSGLRSAGSRLYFGGAEGVTSFDPEKLVRNTYAPKVILSDLQIRNQSVPIQGDKEILTKSIAFSEEITLSYDNANFSINYAIPNFINPNNNQYAYRLIGLDDSWTYTNKTEAFFTLQKPGDYMFEVKGANNDGVWNETPATLNITVKPAPWKSNWAYTIYGLLLVSALYGLYTIMKSKAKLKQDLRWEQLENERKEETNKAKLQFFTNISHDFRTPLTLISGPLQQILADYKGSSIMYKKLLVIESSANHLLQLINRLMDFRKLEDHQSKLRAAEGNIVKFLQEIYLSFSEFAQDQGYTYTLDCSHEKILVYYDRPKLEQVFYNLISNAFKFSPPAATIAIEVKKDTNNIYITIKDTGIGIKEEYRNKVFDRFFEIPSDNNIKNDYNKGTGIGLSIVKNIIELHKGSIIVKSNEPQGSIFEITLPLGNDHLSEEEIISDFKFSDDIVQYTSQLSPKELALQDSLDKIIVDKDLPVILVVEDNEQLRSFFKNLLIKDYKVLEAENGKEGLIKAQKHIPDLIISDVIMPEMVGTELCAQIKQNISTSHIPVILLTARTSLIYKFEGLESGADDYISKPFNITEFKLRVKNLLESTQRLKDKFSSETGLLPNELTVSTLDENLLKKAMDIVEENIANIEFDIPAFCRELGVSRTILFSKIKAWTNFTPNEFINEIRLKRAALFLEKYEINISEVSYKVGFRDPKYFSKCFQKKYGETPSKYGKKFSRNYTE